MPGATLTTNRLLIYGAVSTGLAALAIYITLSTHSNFYSAVVHLSKSNGSILTLANFAAFVALLVAKVVQLIFFGPLRANEVERLYDRAWYFLTESLLAFTIFRDDFDAAFVCMFGGLLFVKSFHWILADRIEAMDQQPYPGPPKLFHIRSIALFNALALVDIIAIVSLIEVILHDGVDGLVLFLSEYTILLASLLSAWLKYVISVYDLFRASQRGGDEAPPWEHKSMYIFYVDLLTDFLKLSTYLAFFLTVLTYYGLPLNIVRDVFLTARSFVSRVRDLMRYRAATRDMDQRYPDALQSEMETMADRTCIICREEMIVRGAAAGGVGAVTNSGPNMTPKRLPCGHVFHFHCLRSWLERQQSCPTCRRTVLDGTRPAGNANGNANPAVPPNQQGAIAIFNRIWNGPAQIQPQANGVPPAVAPAAPAGAPPLYLPPAFPWLNQPPWPPVPQQPQPFQGVHAGGQWHPWGIPPPPENQREREQPQQANLTPTGPVAPGTGAISGASLVASPAAIDRDPTPIQLNHPITGPAPPAPTPVRQVVSVPNKTPPEAKATGSNPTPGTSGSSGGTRPKEAAALAALRRFQATRSSESLKSPPATRASTSSPEASGSATEHRAGSRSPLSSVSTPAESGRAHVPTLIPLYNPVSAHNAPGAGSVSSSPYFAGATNTAVPPLINPQPPTRPRSPLAPSNVSNLPRAGQLPAGLSESQLVQLDRVTREAIDERLHVLEGVQSTVWRCVEELVRLKSTLGESEGRQQSIGSTSAGSIGSSFGVEIERGGIEPISGGVPEISVESSNEGGENEIESKGKGRAVVVENGDAGSLDSSAR